MPPALLDTDILSEVLKQKDAIVVGKAAQYLKEQRHFAISAISRYEVLRGLLFKNATRQLHQFEQFCRHAIVVSISDAILDRTAELWVEGERRGLPHRDADLLIAATAIEESRVLVTGNVHHFNWIMGLAVENWRQS